jgi:hypothetical protein
MSSIEVAIFIVVAMMPWRDWIDPAWWRTMSLWWRVLLLSAWFAIIICVLIMVIVALYALVE